MDDLSGQNKEMESMSGITGAGWLGNGPRIYSYHSSQEQALMGIRNGQV